MPMNYTAIIRYCTLLQEIDPQVQNKSEEIEDMAMNDEDGKVSFAMYVMVCGVY